MGVVGENHCVGQMLFITYQNVSTGSGQLGDGCGGQHGLLIVHYKTIDILNRELLLPIFRSDNKPALFDGYFFSPINGNGSEHLISPPNWPKIPISRFVTISRMEMILSKDEECILSLNEKRDALMLYTAW